LLVACGSELTKRSGLSVPTIQRVEASDGVIRGDIDVSAQLAARPSTPPEWSLLRSASHAPMVTAACG